jgi:amino acid adenylation domain-containing protein/non-ribosomal peptide synthase protein (TIGR01720 family)
MSNKVIEGFHLSPQQAHLWLLQQGGDERAYRAQGVITIEGLLDAPALEAALRRVIGRHEILRTAFRRLPGMFLPLQVITDNSLPHLQQYDLSDMQLSEQSACIDSLLHEMSRLPIALEEGLPLHLRLVKTAPDRHGLLISLPALCMDTTGLKNLLYEIARSSAERPGDEELAYEPMQYADFSDWQNEILASAETAEGKAYWQHNNFSERGALHLPLRKSVTGNDEVDPQVLSITIDAETLLSMEAVASHQQVSLSTLLLGCFHLLLWRLTQQTEIITGLATSGRNYEELETALGLFLRFLPIRARVADELPFNELLREIEQQVQGAQHWQEFFDREQSASSHRSAGEDGEKRVSYISFNYEFVDEDTQVVPSGDLLFKLVKASAYTSRFDVWLRCLRQTDGGLIAEWNYDGRLYATAEIKRLAAEWRAVLASVSDRPGATLGTVNILNAEERAQLLVGFNRTSQTEVNTLCLHELFEAQAKRTPDAVALEFEEQRLSYRELDGRANRLARYLRRIGVGAEERVAVLLERSVEMVVGLLGILKAGGAYVPLDAEYPAERLALMLKDTGARVVITQERLRGVLDGMAASDGGDKEAVIAAQVVSLDVDWREIEQESDEKIESGVNLDNLAYVIYTSGSTGRPKGVMISHGAICNRLLWIQRAFPMTEADRLLQKTPFSFDASVWEIFVPLFSGARLFIAQPGGHRDSAYLVDVIAEHKITTLQLVPSMLRVVLDEPGLGNCTHLRRVFCGGESLPVELQEKFFERVDAELHNLYGPTETSIDATFRTCKPEDEQRGVLIGRPISNIQVHLLNSRLEPEPIGCSGELHVGGIGLARGYLNRPDLTAERFIPNPFSTEPGQRLYRTGDLARYLPDATIEYQGRIDHQVKIRGFRIELGEIEAALCEQRGVQAAIAVAREDEPGRQQLVACIVPTNKSSISAIHPTRTQTASTAEQNRGDEKLLAEEPNPLVSVNELRQALEQRLPDYMVPSAFALLEELPRLPNGKIDRKSLPAPDRLQTRLPEPGAAPRTAVEETLMGIWRQVLRLEHIGIHDNFFELGGDSILSIQIVARANQAGLKLSPKLIFRHQTIAELAQVAAPSVASASARQGLAAGAAPLTPIQHYFFEQQLAEQHHFNQSVLLEVRRRLAAEQLQRVVEQLALHHDALRLRFRIDEVTGGWRQSYAGAEAARQIRVEEIDLSGIGDDEREAALEARAGELQRGLNVEDGPLMRVGLIELGERTGQRLLVVIHHLAVDGVSWRILLEDMARGIEQAERGEAVGWGAKTTSYGQWGERLAEYARAAEVQAESAFWADVVRVAAEAPLPLDYEGQERTPGSSRSVVQHLETDETRALLQEVPAAYHTQINDALLTALVEAIGKWSGQRRLAVEMEGHGRDEIDDEIDLSRTVGWFTSVYPVVLDIEGVETIGAALKQVKEQLRRIPSGGIGYGVLRYLSNEPAIREQLQGVEPVELSFNYLGQLDQALDSDSLFAGASERSGPQQSERARQRYAIEVLVAVMQGKLQVRCTYNEQLHAAETIQRIVNEYLGALRELIAHCQSAEAGGFTPSDFPLVELNQDELDLALSEIDFG